MSDRTNSIEYLKEELGFERNRPERIRILQRLVQQTARHDPHYTLEIAAEGLDLARRERDKHSEAIFLRSIGICRIILLDYDGAIDMLNSAFELLRGLDIPADLATVMQNIGTVYRKKGDYKNALDAYERSRNILEEHAMEDGLGAILNNIGVMYQELSDYSQALEYYRRSLEIGEKNNRIQRVGYALNNLGSVYMLMEDSGNALDCFQRSLEIRRDNDDVYGQAVNLGNIGLIHQELGDVSAALECQQEALKLYEDVDDIIGKALTLGYIGDLCRENGDNDKALEFLLRGRELSEKARDAKTHSILLLRIGRLQRDRSENDLSLEALKQALELAEAGGDRQNEFEAHQAIALTYVAMADFEKAFFHQRRYAAVKDEVRSRESQEKLAEMRLRAEIDQAHKDREIYRLKNEQLELKMELKSKELTTQTMYLVQKNEYLESLRKRIKSAAKTADLPTRRALNSLILDIDDNVHVEDDWASFEQQFQQVHQDFMRILSEQFPNLTPTELKVCALLKVNLSSKEIAKILCVSVRNVESHRYRLRKKLQLPSDVNLQTYIAKI